MDKQNTKVSVIICAYTMDRLSDVKEVVNSVVAQMIKPHEVIISVDHNKQLYASLMETYRDSIEIRMNSINLNQSPNLQSPIPNAQSPISNPRSPIPSPQSPVPIILVLNEGAQGLSETRNVGIRASRGDIIAFIDDDALAEPDWLENLISPFQLAIPNLQSRVVAVGGRTIPLWPNDRRPFWFPEELDWIVGCTYKGLPLNGNQIRNVPGGNMAFTKVVFEKAGFFRCEVGRVGATAGSGEEADLCLRIRHAIPDALIIYEDQATIHHKVTPQRTTWRYIWQRSYNEGFYKAKAQRLHQSIRQTGSTHQTQKTLSTEGSYLRYLLFKSIPNRLTRFYRKGSLPRTAAIIVCIAATAMGYLAGRVRA